MIRASGIQWGLARIFEVPAPFLPAPPTVMTYTRLLHLFVLLCVPLFTHAASPTAMLSDFIDLHCVDCHGAETHKAGLRLDTLSADLGDEKTAATWTRVFDKLVAGEMPPKKRARPPQSDIDATTQ